MPRQLLVKICGITNGEDAVAAIEAGADMLGMIFVESSPRCLSIERALAIREAIDQLPSRRSCRIVGVFADCDLRKIEAVRDQLQLDLVQPHGREVPADVHHIRGCIKALALTSANELNAAAAEFAGACELLIVDRPKGARTAWTDQMEMVRAARVPTPFLMAGGIDAENAGTICGALLDNPHFAGIDVASGIESAPGEKDHERMRRLIAAVKGVANHAITR
jgi:phosphoribosylanthranilate isomerase